MVHNQNSDNKLGDVMYHLGTQARLDYSGPDLPLGVSEDALEFLEEAGLGARDYSLDISLAPNPSHLEAVNPVVMGKARYLQHSLGDDDCTRVLGLLVHGDAAFIGQVISPIIRLGTNDVISGHNGRDP